MFALLIVARILFLACIIFIIGYIFGGFSKKKSLSTLARISAILIIVSFIMINVFAMHSGRFRNGWCPDGSSHAMHWHKQDQMRHLQDSTDLR